MRKLLDSVRLHESSYIVEHAPWLGGFWERSIVTCKRLMRKISSKASLTVKELETVICRVKSTLNSRPITYQCNSTNEPRALTPNYLILGPDPVSSLPIWFGDETMPPSTTRLELTEVVKYKQLLFNQFENRFSSLTQPDDSASAIVIWERLGVRPRKTQGVSISLKILFTKRILMYHKISK